MELRITIDMDNAAFDDDEAGPELARILRAVAANCADEGPRESFRAWDIPLRDVNGNRAGRVWIEHCDHGDQLISTSRPILCRYDDARMIRNATDAELAASVDAAKSDGGAGVIEVDGVDCYVVE